MLPDDDDETPGFTYEDVPPSKDRSAHWISAQRAQPDTYPELTDRSGKWMIFVAPAGVDAVWARIRKFTIEGRLGGEAKVSSALARDAYHGTKPTAEHVICVYTYDALDRDDVFRVRDALGMMGFTGALSYKTDQTTLAGRYFMPGGPGVSLYRGTSSGQDPFDFETASTPAAPREPPVVSVKGRGAARRGTLLTIDLVPKSCWYSNVRSEVSTQKWKTITRAVYAEANYTCEVCGGRGGAHPVECHEKWDYNDDTEVQRLLGLQALCPACHEVKHFGLAQVRGHEDRAFAHLRWVNNWTVPETTKHVTAAFELWTIRSSTSWTLNIDYLRRWGIEKAPVRPGGRYR